MANTVTTTALLCLLLYVRFKLLEGSSVTGCRVSKYHVNRVNTGTFPAKAPFIVVWTRPKRLKKSITTKDSGKEQDVFDFCAVWKCH